MQLTSLSLALTAPHGAGGDAPPPSLALADLTDVELTAPQNGDELVFDATQAKWVNEQ
jgi:hypothetical protein